MRREFSPRLLNWRVMNAKPKYASVASCLERVLWRLYRARSRSVVRRQLKLRVEGLHFIPRDGPVIVAGRHFHDAYDMAGLVSRIPRQAHFFVAVDWQPDPKRRRLMELGTRALRWPSVVRPEQLAWMREAERLRQRESALRKTRNQKHMSTRGTPITPEMQKLVDSRLQDSREQARRQRASDETEARSYLRRAVADGVALLQDERLLIVAPEGYANIGQAFNPKNEAEETLPFQEGFLRLAALAQKSGSKPVAIVPVGAHYARLSNDAKGRDRWRVVLRFAAPLYLDAKTDKKAFLRRMENEVEILCRAPKVS